MLLVETNPIPDDDMGVSKKLECFHLGVDPEGNVSLEELIQTLCHFVSHRDIRVSHRGMRVSQNGTGVYHR